MYNNDDFNNDFSSGGQYMNEQYFRAQDAIAKNSFEVGKRLKKIFWLYMVAVITLIAFIVILFVSCYSIITSYILGSMKSINYSTFSGLSGMEFLVFLSIFLIIGALAYLIIYLILLFEMKPYEADFGTAALMLIIYIPVTIVGACFPYPLRYLVQIATSALQIASSYYFLNGMYNSMRKVDVSRANTLATLRNVVVGFSVATGILSFISSFDTSGFLAIVYLLVSVGAIGVSIWQFVMVWKTGSFLQKYGKENMTTSNFSF